MLIAPKPKMNVSSDSHVKIDVDFARVRTWPEFPERSARRPVIGRIAIGPTMKTAVPTWRMLMMVSMTPSLRLTEGFYEVARAAWISPGSPPPAAGVEGH